MQIADAFDLALYLDRIGLGSPPAADAEGLLTLQRAHRLAIPFENIDVILGRPISLAPEAIFDKLVRRRRGGYCFEQNSLFLMALHALGFTARPLLARVWLGAETIPPHTHTLNLVTIDGAEWIADAGFGASYASPMRLLADMPVAFGSTLHRLREDEAHGWMLERSGPAMETDGRADGGAQSEWERQISFTTTPIWPADLQMGNHFASTGPGGRFVENVVASIVLPNGFASIFNRRYSRASGSGIEQAEISSARMLQMRLSLMFGIDLSAEEVTALGLFA